MAFSGLVCSLCHEITGCIPYTGIWTFLISNKLFLNFETSTRWHSLFFQKSQLVVPYTAFLVRDNACTMWTLAKSNCRMLKLNWYITPPLRFEDWRCKASVLRSNHAMIAISDTFRANLEHPSVIKRSLKRLPWNFYFHAWKKQMEGFIVSSHFYNFMGLYGITYFIITPY